MITDDDFVVDINTVENPDKKSDRDDGIKWCFKCKKFKKLEAFHHSSRKKDGYRDMCKTCVREYQKEVKARKVKTEIASAEDKFKKLNAERIKQGVPPKGKLLSAKEISKSLILDHNFDILDKYVTLYKKAERNKDYKLMKELLLGMAPYIYSKRASVATLDDNGDKVEFNLDLGGSPKKKSKTPSKSENIENILKILKEGDNIYGS